MEERRRAPSRPTEQNSQILKWSGVEERRGGLDKDTKRSEKGQICCASRSHDPAEKVAEVS